MPNTRQPRIPSRTSIPLDDAFASLTSARDARQFLADICTPAEIRALNERWAIAQYLDQTSKSYRDIAAELHASVTTVARVARFLRQENHQGYKRLLDQFYNKRNP